MLCAGGAEGGGGGEVEEEEEGSRERKEKAFLLLCFDISALCNFPLRVGVGSHPPTHPLPPP